MRINLKDKPTKYDPNPIWKDGALGFYWRMSPQHEQQQQDE